MEASRLIALWSTTDNSRTTGRQYSFRLPVHVAAKLAALEELYPTRSRTQLVGDLLTEALATVERALPVVIESTWGHDQATGEKLLVAGGLRNKYRHLANKYHETIERELGNRAPRKLFDELLVISEREK